MLKKLVMAGLMLASTAAFTPVANAGPIIGSPGRYDGGRVSISTQTGTNCSATAPDRASVGVAAGYESVDRNNFTNGSSGYDNSGFTGGVYISMPLGGADVGNCNTILQVEENRTRLDMAVTLFEAGGMTADELKQIATEIKQDLLK